MNQSKLALVFGCAILGPAVAWSQSVAGIGLGSNNNTTIVWNNGDNAYGAATYGQGGNLIAAGPWRQPSGGAWYTPPQAVAIDINNNPLLGFAENDETSPPFDIAFWRFNADDEVEGSAVFEPPLEETFGGTISVSGFAVDANGPVYDISAGGCLGAQCNNEMAHTWEHFNQNPEYLFSDLEWEFEQDSPSAGVYLGYAVASDGTGRQLVSSGGSAPSIMLYEPNPHNDSYGEIGGFYEIVESSTYPIGGGWTGWYPVGITTTPNGATEVLWDAYDGTTCHFSWWDVAAGPFSPLNPFSTDTIPVGTSEVSYMSPSWQFSPGWIAVGIAGSPFGGDGNIRILMENNWGTGNAPTQFVVLVFNPTAGNEVTGYYVAPPPA